MASPEPEGWPPLIVVVLALAVALAVWVGFLAVLVELLKYLPWIGG